MSVGSVWRCLFDGCAPLASARLESGHRRYCDRKLLPGRLRSQGCVMVAWVSICDARAPTTRNTAPSTAIERTTSLVRTVFFRVQLGESLDGESRCCPEREAPEQWITVMRRAVELPYGWRVHAALMGVG
jgi:hypothetical protein